MSSEHFRGSRLNHTVRAALMIGVAAGAVACSQVPDAVNPAEWYRKTVDVFAGDEKAKPKRESTKENELRADRGKAPPGADKPFPNLASVDEKARRDDLSGGLGADPERPKYAPAIERQGPAGNVLRPKPPAPPAVAAAPAPPPAVPTRPVTAAPPPAAIAKAPTPMPAPAAQARPAPVQAARAPVTATADQREQEARLTQQLAEIRARALETGPLPANAMLPATTGEFATVVVSSEGIQTAGPMAAADQAMAAPMRTAGRSVPMGPSVKVATILFDNGSARLKADDKRILGAVSRLYKERGGTVRVVGHASSRTRNLSEISHKMANFKISVDRADAVAKELMRLGVRKENIQVAAVADTEPVYFEIMPSGEAGNRRTEVYLVR